MRMRDTMGVLKLLFFAEILRFVGACSASGEADLTRFTQLGSKNTILWQTQHVLEQLCQEYGNYQCIQTQRKSTRDFWDCEETRARSGFLYCDFDSAFKDPEFREIISHVIRFQPYEMSLEEYVLTVLSATALKLAQWNAQYEIDPDDLSKYALLDGIDTKTLVQEQVMALEELFLGVAEGDSLSYDSWATIFGNLDAIAWAFPTASQRHVFGFADELQDNFSPQELLHMLLGKPAQEELFGMPCRNSRTSQSHPVLMYGLAFGGCYRSCGRASVFERQRLGQCAPMDEYHAERSWTIRG